MMRFLLLVILPLLAASELTEQQRLMEKYVEDNYGPCILRGTGCPDNSFTYERISTEVAGFKKNYAKLVPEKCRCDESSEQCIRVCYLEIVKLFYSGAIGAESGKRSTNSLTEEQRQRIKYVEDNYGPCILRGTGCPDNSFTYERIANEVANFKKYFAKVVPKKCRCNESSEQCIRVCYLEILKLFYSGALSGSSKK